MGGRFNFVVKKKDSLDGRKIEERYQKVRVRKIRRRGSAQANVTVDQRVLQSKQSQSAAQRRSASLRYFAIRLWLFAPEPAEIAPACESPACRKGAELTYFSFAATFRLRHKIRFQHHTTLHHDECQSW